jgi:hypothetical protein
MAVEFVNAISCVLARVAAYCSSRSILKISAEIGSSISDVPLNSAVFRPRERKYFKAASPMALRAE